MNHILLKKKPKQHQGLSNFKVISDITFNKWANLFK